jgi:DNA repair protein RadB
LTCIRVENRIPIGCRSIDGALGGGISFGSVGLIYGEAETGKTTLAMQLAVNCARRCYKTLFVDCDGTFSAERLVQLASKNVDSLAKMIVLMRPKSFREQAIVVDRLNDYVSKDFGLIVVDTVTSLYRLNVSESPEETFELNRALNRQLASLAQIAKTRRVSVMMVSQVHASFKEGYAVVEPVATRVLKFWADTIIGIRPTRNPQLIKATLEKSPTDSRPMTYDLLIENAGIREL